MGRQKESVQRTSARVVEMTTPTVSPAPGGGLLLPAPRLVDDVYAMDALAFLRCLPNDSVDLIATDPPYGIGYESSWMTRMDGTPRKARTMFGPDVFDASWIVEAARCLKPSGALYLFTRWDVCHLWKAALEAAGLKVPQRIIWDKSHWGMGDLSYFGSQVEDLLFAVKDRHKLRYAKREGNLWNVWRGRVWEDGYRDHPTQKPLTLMAKIVRLSCPPNGIVLDPFLGSGTTVMAAKALSCHYIGCDIDPHWCDVTRQRLAQPYTLPLFTDTTPAPAPVQLPLGMTP